MADNENSIFSNLPRKRRLADDDNTRSVFREALGMYVPEGPLPPRPHPSGKGGPSINQGTAPPVVTSVWSATDAAANGMTLSNGGLTVTGSGAAVWKSARSSISQTAGKLYAEFAVGAITNGNQVFGLASAGFNPSDYLGDNPVSVGLWPNGFAVGTAGFTTNYTPNFSVVSNIVVGVAVDFTAGKLWLAGNNLWSNSSNPATGALPAVSFTPATVGALFLGVSFNGAGNGSWTLQPTAASQTYAPPAGFSAWG